MERDVKTTELSRRTFLTTSSAAVVGAALGGLVPQSEAAMRHPERGGTLKFATRLDATGLDSHRHNQYHTSMPIAAMYTGLTDITYAGKVVPGVAESYEPSQDLKSWVFRLRKGVLFHNGREVDADAIKQNLMRIKDPAIGSGWHRGTIKSVESVDILDKYTVRIHLSVPDASLPANVLHYPTNLQAPDNFEKSSEHPIGTGPFKFVSWNRFDKTELVRFENYWETDAQGNNLPYLDEIIGRPKRADAVRLTALRTNEVNLIDHMAYASVESFKKRYSDQFNVWPLHLGGVFVVFNWRNGPFRNNKLLRMAASHAIDREAIHRAVFYGHARMLTQPYPPGNPWHMEGYNVLEYDPDKARSMIKKARAVGTAIHMIGSTSPTYAIQCAEVIQSMWTEVGFKVKLEPVERAVRTEKLKKGDFHAHIQGHSYRFDPDAFFDRNLHSQSAYAQRLHGWHNARYDKLIEEAKRTRDPAKRRELYTEGWKIVNEELPQFHLSELSMISAAHKSVQNYEPSKVAPFTYSGGGVRTAYIQG